jgi:putative DNA primase/helicase
MERITAEIRKETEKELAEAFQFDEQGRLVGRREGVVKISPPRSKEAMATIHDLYERLGFVVMSGEMTAKQNKKGEWRKEFAFRPNWAKLNKHDYNRDATGFAILTGEKSNTTVIDIDDPDTETNQQLMDLMTQCNLVAKTKKGYHYYWAYDPRIKQTTGDKLDTRNDGGCIFCEPSAVSAPSGEVVASYEFIKQPFEDEELLSLPDEVVEFLAKTDKRYVGGEEDETVRLPTMDATTTTSASNPTDTDPTLLKLAECITASDTYDEWLRNGLICYNERLGLDVWEVMSRKGRGYEEGACGRKWASFQSNKERKLTQATWWKWLKTHNAPKYWELMEERKDFWDKIALLNHKDIAKYFWNIHPDAYVWDEVLGWYSLTRENVWKHYDKSQPSGLKRHIADTLQDLAMETKKALLARYAKESEKETDAEKQKELLKRHQKQIADIHQAYKLFGSSEFCNGVIAFLPSFFEKDDLEKVMDMNRYVFAFSDGQCYDLSTGVKRSLVPTDYVSTTTGYPMPKTTNATVRKSIKQFLWGLFENADTQTYLEQVLASCLFGGNRWEEFYVLTGTGGNGKGVIAELMTNTFGGYYQPVDITLFTKPLERKDQPIPALVEARCKRVMMTTEPETDDKLQVGLIKKISGGDPIEARTLHSKHIVKYVPQYKVIFQMNGIPKLNKLDDGVKRRMRIIHFPFKFRSAEKMGSAENDRLADPDVKEHHCKSETWRNEFIQMLWETYQSIKSLKALKEPASVKEATEEYLDDNNPLKFWLETKFDLTKTETDRIGATDLKRMYCEDHSIDKMAMGDQQFAQALGFNGINRKRLTSGIVYTGLRRKAERVFDE